MFDIEQAVNAWCASIFPGGCAQDERQEELRDHLLCEVDHLREKGLDEEQAFLEATRRLGDAGDLRTELAKNNNLWQTLCAIERAQKEALIKQGLSPKREGAITIIHSLTFAAAMILAPLLVADSGDASEVVFAILMPVWFVTFLLLPGQRHSLRHEWKFLKRVFGSTR